MAAWAGHRAPAFEACRFLIEELKSRAPFWKYETLNDGTRWVRKKY
ncbi:Molybdopterin-converting factor subunit 2 [Beggiatoa sp. PS]|nr:Molybdopterin-converting factor subunit 2 [Beggiatoa sp. PS]